MNHQRIQPARQRFCRLTKLGVECGIVPPHPETRTRHPPLMPEPGDDRAWPPIIFEWIHGRPPASSPAVQCGAVFRQQRDQQSAAAAILQPWQSSSVRLGNSKREGSLRAQRLILPRAGKKENCSGFKERF